jgi:AI-2 transport protein TqsA
MSQPVHTEPSTAASTWQTRTSLSLFVNRLLIVTLGLLLLYLLVWLLREFQSFLQPLFIAVFIGYLILPVHQWLTRHGVPGALVYPVILFLILGGLFGVGAILYHNTQQAIDRWDEDYKKKVEGVLEKVQTWLPEDVNLQKELGGLFDQSDQAVSAIRAALGTALNLFTALAITFIYLVFLIAEKMSFPQRMKLAFGETRGEKVLEVTATINQAIAEYIAVKTFVSVVAGILSMAVLAVFGLDFYITWGLLIFLLNYIPYLGSLVAVALPIGLSFIQLGMWQGIVIALLLIAIQEAIGIFVEPRMAGSKLGLSPLLILLSLSFWGVIWGIPGMILAVPLLVTIKIVLYNIAETRPLAILMSNV